MEYIFFLLLGMGVGTFGTLVGIGGGLICVPIFIFLMSDGGLWPCFSTAGQIAGTSLFVVLANAVSGTMAYVRQRRVYFNAAVPFALTTLPGAFLGSYIVDKFSNEMLDMYFGVFLLVMAVLMYWNATHKPHSEVKELPRNFKFDKNLGIGSSMFVGFLSSIFGIGGGVIHVPLMVYLLGFPVHVATATSHFVLAVSSLAGVVSHFLLSHIVWLPALGIGAGAVIGAQIGAKISKKTKSKVILALLSLAMFALGVRLMLLGSLH